MKKSAIATALIVAVLTFMSCHDQRPWADIWKQTGVLADSFIRIYAPNWSHRDEFHDAWQKAYDTIEDWKTGTPCQNVIQGINKAVGLLAQLPVTGAEQTNLMAAIAASVHSVTLFFSTCAPTPKVQSFSSDIESKASQLPPPKSVKDVNSLWRSSGGVVP